MVNFASQLTFGPTTADWQQRLNVDRMRQYRVERARKIMKKNGIPVLLEASGTNVRYLTGLKGFNYPMCRFVLFFAEHDPVMY